MRDRGDGAPGGEQGRKKEARSDQRARRRGGASARELVREGRATAGARRQGKKRLSVEEEGPSRAIYKKGFSTGCT